MPVIIAGLNSLLPVEALFPLFLLDHGRFQYQDQSGQGEFLGQLLVGGADGIQEGIGQYCALQDRLVQEKPDSGDQMVQVVQVEHGEEPEGPDHQGTSQGVHRIIQVAGNDQQDVSRPA